MSIPPSSPTAQQIADSNRIAEAALRRLDQSATTYDDEELRYEQERPIRQKFRRLADPGIIRDNSDAAAKKVSPLERIKQLTLTMDCIPGFRGT